jgi:hypothetical protein
MATKKISENASAEATEDMSNTAELTSVLASPSSINKTRIVIVHGDKGGVGKSFVGQAIANLLASRNLNCAVIDADTSNPDVSRMFEKNIQCIRTNIRVENGWMSVLDFVMANRGSTIVLNTPAGVGDYMKDDLRSLASFFSHEGVDVEMDLWWVMNHGHDSVNLLKKAHNLYGNFFKRLRVVCNLHFSDGKVEPFFLWNESPFKTALEKQNCSTIYFPGLNLRAAGKVFVPTTIMPFFEAVDAALGEALSLEHSERWKLQEWLQEVDRVLAPAFDLEVASAV